MDHEELMQLYGSLIGENVEFLGSDDEEKSGRLTTIAINKDTEEPEAHIRTRKKGGFMSYQSLGTEKIPLSRLLTKPTSTEPTPTVGLRLPRTTESRSRDDVSPEEENAPTPAVIRRLSAGNSPVQRIPRIQRSSTVAVAGSSPSNKTLYPTLDDFDTNEETVDTKEDKEPAAPVDSEEEELESPPVLEDPPRVVPLPRLRMKPASTEPREEAPTERKTVTLEDLQAAIREITDPVKEEVKPTSQLGQNKNEHHFQGIQGHATSSFIDAAFFALFSYSSALDHIFHRLETDDKVTTLLKKIVRKDIVSPLRRNYFVPVENMLTFREKLAENARPEYLFTSIDLAECLNTLFVLMNSEEFLEYDSGEKDFIHEIMVPLDPTGRRMGRFQSLQELLDLSFVMAGLRLLSRPSHTFMVKMASSSSFLLGCEGVMPNLTLKLGNILEEDDSAEQQVMSLSAVICKKNDHFVAFARNGQDETSPWLFMNSDPDNSIPKVEVFKDLTKDIEWCLEEASKSGADVAGEEPKCDGFRLFSDAYMFIYV